MGDVNGDGDLDAVFANVAKNRLCWGDGSGSFFCGDVSSDSNTSRDVALGDVNGDGNLDAVFANTGHYRLGNLFIAPATDAGFVIRRNVGWVDDTGVFKLEWVDESNLVAPDRFHDEVTSRDVAIPFVDSHVGDGGATNDVAAAAQAL